MHIISLTARKETAHPNFPKTAKIPATRPPTAYPASSKSKIPFESETSVPTATPATAPPLSFPYLAAKITAKAAAIPPRLIFPKVIPLSEEAAIAAVIIMHALSPEERDIIGFRCSKAFPARLKK